MNYCFDANLPPALAYAIQALCDSEPDVHICHLKDYFEANTPDVEWLGQLGSDPDEWVVVTQDRLNKNAHEIAARKESGVITFVLRKTWATQDFWSKAHRLVRWWPRIMEQANLVRGGSAFEVPWNVSGKGRFKQIP